MISMSTLFAFIFLIKFRIQTALFSHIFLSVRIFSFQNLSRDSTFGPCTCSKIRELNPQHSGTRREQLPIKPPPHSLHNSPNQPRQPSSIILPVKSPQKKTVIIQIRKGRITASINYLVNPR